jgi:reductive dehalogenase
MPIGKMQDDKFANRLPQPGNPGWTELDGAFFMAAWSVHDHAAPGDAGGVPQAGPLYSWDYPSNERKTNFKSAEEATHIIKKAALFLGASLVGIAPYDERWVYSHWFDYPTGKSLPVKFPFKPKSVIVMALEMDYEAFKTAPSLIEQAATGNQYSNMAVVSHKVASFCRQLGYKAANCGNDTAMSMPLAIHAGLGEMSRMGLLVTPEYGPRVRLCKVFTDIELVPDKPISFGVTEFCKVCMKCADNCPSGAIPRDVEPSFKTANKSNNPGAKKWCIDAEKCFQFWAENGGDCGTCIASCPYNKTDEWHHVLSSKMTQTPARPVLRYFDELFGYGKTYNEKVIAEYWKK